MSRATNGIHTITIPATNKKGVRPRVKVGDRVQFSSEDGRFNINFPRVWPFKKPHSKIGSRFDKEAELWKSRILTLVEKKAAKFDCYIKNYGGPAGSEYGG